MNSIASAGSVLGSRYVLEQLIAVGGMGQVWKATDQVLDRSVAVKLLRTDLIDSEDFRRRFRAEARLAAGLSHPGIAHVYDYAEGVPDGPPLAFLVMELVAGQPLSEHLRRCRPTLRETVSILDQTAHALGAAHDVGIVHRDVKPGNVLITPEGRVKVTDFGIARAIDTADITEVGQVIGTVRYMSPEQACGEEVTPASDVYSLAVIGYEMLAGRTPFDGDTPVAIALAHVQTTPQALPTSVPAELRSLIEQSLAKQPEQRPRDGERFASALQRIAIDPTPPAVRSTTINPAPPSPPERSSGMQATAVFHHPPTAIERSSTADEAGTAIAPAVPSLSDEPLLAQGWVQQQRRRRRVAAWGAALAVAACLLGLILFNGSADRDPLTVAADTTVTTPAPPAAAATSVVTIDPAAYIGRPEADVRAALTASGVTAVTRPGPSTADLAGLVIDVQPSGPVAPGSDVTIIVGDGAVATATNPAAVDPGAGHGNGKGKDKPKGKNHD